MKMSKIAIVIKSDIDFLYGLEKYLHIALFSNEMFFYPISHLIFIVSYYI